MPPDGPQRGGPGKGRNGEGREVIFEYVPIGGSVKVSAIDVQTGLEVSVIGPSSAARTELERVALRKLKYMLERPEREPGKKEPGSEGGPGGIVV